MGAERRRIGLREVRGLESNSEVWDSAVPGFGARRREGAAISYVLMFRTADGRQRRFTIGRHGAPWTPDMAREEARRLLGEVVRGGDPAADKQTKRKAATVAELCDLYLAEAEVGRLLTRMKRAKKTSTLRSDRSRIEGHIKPLIGRLKVPSVTTADVERLMHAIAEGETANRRKTGKKRGVSNVRGGIGTASRTVGLLGAIFTYAMRKRMRADNPVRGVMRPADGTRDRRLSDPEYNALGTALGKAEVETYWPAAISCARFLALTGWRSGEALGLRWRDVDLARRTATLPDSKSGRSMRPLSSAACDVLRRLGRTRDDALVFPASRGSVPMSGFRKQWNRMVGLGKLPADVTPHVLRHSFSSLAADLGYSEPVIAAMIGHKGQSITSRYVHSVDAVLLAAADAVGRRTLELMSGECAHADNVLPLYVDRAG